MSTRHSIPDSIEDEAYNEAIGEDYAELHSSLDGLNSSCRVGPKKFDEGPGLGFGVGTNINSSAFDEINYNILIEIRMRNQTKQAATGVRTKTSYQLQDPTRPAAANDGENDDPKAVRSNVLKSIAQRWLEVI